jgi:hypothetical protein
MVVVQSKITAWDDGLKRSSSHTKSRDNSLVNLIERPKRSSLQNEMNDKIFNVDENG